jgi:hypothetical protein
MSPLVRKNERREIRRALRFECSVVRERDFRFVAREAIDVSPDGILVSTYEQLDPGESVIVSFCATELGLWFDTEASVARIVRGMRYGDRGPAIGLTFSSLSRVKRFILRNHLRRIPPPVPRRTQRIDWTETVRRIA